MADEVSRKDIAPGEFDPWTHAVHVHWPVSFAFLERRFSILRKLQGMESLSGYRIDEGEIGARFRGDSIRLDVDRVSLTLAVVYEGMDQKFLTAVLETVLEDVEPQTLNSVLSLFQHLIPGTGTAEELQAFAADVVAGDIGGPLHPTDFSLQMEGKLENAKVNLTTGVVSAEEAVDRLASRAWTVAAKEAKDKKMVAFWKKREIPAAAVYVNSDWFWGNLDEVTDPLQKIQEMWSKSQALSVDIARSVKSQMCPIPAPELTEGSES